MSDYDTLKLELQTRLTNYNLDLAKILEKQTLTVLYNKVNLGVALSIELETDSIVVVTTKNSLTIPLYVNSTYKKVGNQYIITSYLN